MRHLDVIALDGAVAGQRLLDSLGLAARLRAPIDPAQLRAQLHVAGTPLLLRVEPDGRVSDAVLGDLSEPEVRAWAAWAF